MIRSIDDVRFDRAHFQAFGDFSLDFEVVYYVLVPEYNRYMDIQPEINLRLFAEFKEEGIAFAYPTREVILRPAQNADPKQNSALPPLSLVESPSPDGR